MGLELFRGSHEPSLGDQAFKMECALQAKVKGNVSAEGLSWMVGKVKMLKKG